MSGDLIDRLSRGDASARALLMDRAHARLIALAEGIPSSDLTPSSPETASVPGEARKALDRMVDTSGPSGSSLDLCRQIALGVRQALIDPIGSGQRRRDEPTSTAEDRDLTESRGADDQTVWRERLDCVESLPADEREVFQFHYFLGLSRPEIAALLGLAPREVDLLWIRATERLADGLLA